MSDERRPASPGLKWRPRRHGAPVPYWCASPGAIKAGYPVKSVPLKGLSGEALAVRCERLQAEMKEWLGQSAGPQISFDGTFRTLLELYETDPDSSFHDLKPGVQRTYLVYIRRLRAHIGELRLDQCSGADAKRWFKEWRFDPDTGRERLARANMIWSVLKAAVAFGRMKRFAGVRDFREATEDLEFPSPKSRTAAPTAAEVTAVRMAAVAAGAPERALVYSLQFETTLRGWDIIGVWLPMRAKASSVVHAAGTKWVGPMWSAIDERGIIRIRPTKTEDTTAIEVVFDLSVCPMVQEDLARIAQERRQGPLIVDPATDLPYRYQTFLKRWRADFEAAGVDGIWWRDLRAGGVTEGRRSGAAKDDMRKLAGHAREETTDIYDRDMIESHRRAMASRTAFRKQKNGA